MRASDLIGKTNCGYVVVDAVGHPSQHVDDAGRLFYVMGEGDGRYSYVTWLYNAETGGFSDGHYFGVSAKNKAIQDLSDRASQ
jgi:hypothetical protein